MFLILRLFFFSFGEFIDCNQFFFFVIVMNMSFESQMLHEKYLFQKLRYVFLVVYG